MLTLKTSSMQYWRNERKAIKNVESKEVIFYKNREPGKKYLLHMSER